MLIRYARLPASTCMQVTKDQWLGRQGILKVVSHEKSCHIPLGPKLTCLLNRLTCKVARNSPMFPNYYRCGSGKVDEAILALVFRYGGRQLPLKSYCS
jgi:hypothetical protein